MWWERNKRFETGESFDSVSDSLSMFTFLSKVHIYITRLIINIFSSKWQIQIEGTIILLSITGKTSC